LLTFSNGNVVDCLEDMFSAVDTVLKRQRDNINTARSEAFIFFARQFYWLIMNIFFELAKTCLQEGIFFCYFPPNDGHNLQKA
jgi:hypothetical protein